ncbi:AAA family ATPase [Caballeronia sp. GAFFF1]|uniref:AAA family ATPase n=1 Tax=Caballeronia sp. GAFFF1 TaxID=2921779 RepID=UPI00202800D7|nr:AAA family ATPase [Caballeronia sp. GAFFF1]
MSTTDLPFLKSKNKTAARAADFIAFVSDRTTEQVLKSFVLEQAMPHVHIAVGTVDDAIAYLERIERSPLFLMIDLQDSVMPLSDLGRLAEVCEPSVQVVALGERNDVGLFRSLLKLGVRDYLVKPLTVELLKRTVNVAGGKVSDVVMSRAGKTIAFVGSRGGVGVTTLALNVARYLSDETHRRVAYVDLNLHGSAANVMLGLQSNNGLSDVLENQHRLDPQYVDRTLVAKGTRLFMLTAERPFSAAPAFEPGSLARVLQVLCDSFHYVIIDIPGPSDALAQEAFDHASRCYIVADRSVHSARETIKLLRHIEDRDNNPPTSLLLNNPNAATAGKVQPADFVGAIGRAVLHEIPFESKAVAVAENLGEKPKDKSQNGFTQSVVRVAADLTGQHTMVERSFLQKFKLRRG